MTNVTDPGDPLDEQFLPEQYDDPSLIKLPTDNDAAATISKQIFSLDEPPRWVILFNYSSLVLIDRSKWAEKTVPEIRIEYHPRSS